MAKIKLHLGDDPGNIEKHPKYTSSGFVFDIFSDDLMKQHTIHSNFTDFCQAIGCDMTSQEDLDKLDNGGFDESIKTQSEFESWEDMVETVYQLQIRKN